MFKHHYFAELTDINLKEMMFEHRMLEIEEDVVPFGVFDDGTDYIDALEMQEELKNKEWMIPFDYDQWR